MDRLGLKDGEMIQHPMITRSIERAQKKVEENNFGIRKRLLEYDDVMNSQREVIYKRRRHALLGERLAVDIANMMYDVISSLVDLYQNTGNFEEFEFDLIRSFSMDSPVKKEEFLRLPHDELTEIVYKKVIEVYKRKEEAISAQAYPVLKDVYDRMSHMYENVVVPVSDGIRVFHVVSNLKATVESKGREIMRAYEKTVVLATIDDAWKEHLREMDDLKQAVQNATYEQKDPLLIYKLESYELFKSMLNQVNKDIVSTLMKGYIPVQDPDQVREAERRRKVDTSKLREVKSDFSQYSNTAATSGGHRKVEPLRVEKKVGRNDPCPCGSGKKYKHCHGRFESAGTSPA
jgi:preprotein translocase subunit SecA